MDQLIMFEFAALAAGLQSKRYHVRELAVVHVRTEDSQPWRLFDPLQRDADAAELAAAARVDVWHHVDYVVALIRGTGTLRVVAHDYDGAPPNPLQFSTDVRLAAWRRAVTECAAYFGRDVGKPWWRS